MKSHPRSISFGKSGDAENMAELSDGFASAMRNGLIMVYAVLVLLFGSFLQPITILFSLPLSIGGAIIALLLGGMQLTRAGVDRHPDADGHRHQERHHAGRLRDRIDPRRDGPRRRRSSTPARSVRVPS